MVVLAALSGVDDPCKRVGQRYEAAKKEVIEAVRAYERCIAASRARETCEAEFGDLDLAQDRYERAVADYRDACPTIRR
jgi:hypothetical protein